MEGGGRGKLSLKRKRFEDKPEASGPSRPPKPEVSQGQGLPWRAPIRAAQPHLTCPGLEDMASLPAFLPKGKRSPTANPAAKPETFHAGMQKFQWVPFPLYQREGTKGSKPRRPQNSGIKADGRKENEEDKNPKIVPPVTSKEHTSEISEMTSILAAGEPHCISVDGQEKTEDPSKEMQLEKCPLCQMRFIGNWSQLDVDSHLAQCLSESTDDTW
nr:Fanconi anemia core complex-associated protein 20 [Anolis sagrei ordinatus]